MVLAQCNHYAVTSATDHTWHLTWLLPVLTEVTLLLQGSCGYGDMDKSKYPFWSVAALSTSNSFYKAGPINGCGECFEIKCLNSGGNFAVSYKGVGFTLACTSLCAPVRDHLAGCLISILFWPECNASHNGQA